MRPLSMVLALVALVAFAAPCDAAPRLNKALKGLRSIKVPAVDIVCDDDHGCGDLHEYVSSAHGDQAKNYATLERSIVESLIILDRKLNYIIVAVNSTAVNATIATDDDVEYNAAARTGGPLLQLALTTLAAAAAAALASRLA